ncbi:unnamed protein product [Hymenolepis diminuta]|uniref:Uncharacterized protein n=1 Tax=Hymenolepis diminuta TaxID=6216 RepID=A0A158QEN9_HYMDI|nr:unnamed protein product [Hymenolepis diminuta]
MSLHHGHCRERNTQDAVTPIRASDGDAANIVPSLRSKVADPHKRQPSTPISSLYQSKRIHSHRGQLDLYHQLLDKFLQINPKASGSGHRSGSDIFVKGSLDDSDVLHKIGILGVTVSDICRMWSGFLRLIEDRSFSGRYRLNVAHNPAPQSSPRRDFLTTGYKRSSVDIDDPDLKREMVASKRLRITPTLQHVNKRRNSYSSPEEGEALDDDEYESDDNEEQPDSSENRQSALLPTPDQPDLPPNWKVSVELAEDPILSLECPSLGTTQFLIQQLETFFSSRIRSSSHRGSRRGIQKTLSFSKYSPVQPPVFDRRSRNRLRDADDYGARRTSFGVWSWDYALAEPQHVKI